MNWLTTGFAAIAAAGTVWAEWRRHRDRPTVSWGWATGPDVLGAISRGAGGRYLVRLGNIGDAAAAAVGVEGFSCTVLRGRTGPPFTSIAPGAEVTFPVDVDPGCDDEAYVVVMWLTTPARRQVGEAQWFPVRNGGPLEAVARQQMTTRRTGLRPWRRTSRQPAGPDGVARRRVRATRRALRRMHKQRAKAES